MPAPLIAAAVKVAAKQLSKAAAKSAIKKAAGAGGSGDDGGGIMLKIAAVVVSLALLFGGVGIYAVVQTVLMVIPLKAEVCDALDGGSSVDDGEGPGGTSGGTNDGTYGSNVPYPTTSSTKVVVPVANPVITSTYGYRQVPAGSIDFFGTGTYFHNGLDFGQPQGSPIYAAADGIIAQSAPNNHTANGYGTVVTIHHLIGGKKMNTTYGHVMATSLKFKVGDTVKAGQQIAGVGMEGNSTGPHLHFVVTEGIYNVQSEMGRDPVNNIDPQPWLAANGAKPTTGGIDEGDGGGGAGGGDNADANVDLCEQKGDTEADGSISAWGGFNNGEIPNTSMKTLGFDTRYKLEKEAATALETLNIAYKAKFGKNIPIEKAYIPKNIQEMNKDYPVVHGWAKTIDIVKPMDFSSDEYKWLAENGPLNGWMNPKVNQFDGSSRLPTRWSYVGRADTGAALPATLSAYQKYAGEQLQANGFGGTKELACLVNLWERESNWNPKAINPAFAVTDPALPQYQAYGIPQGAPGAKMSSAGPDWETNPKTQIKWGIGYIKERYGTPCGAWQHSEDNNWY